MKLLSIIESPVHPDLSKLYAELGLAETRVNSMRKAISHIKQNPVDYIVAEFFYGYGNDYAGVTVSNVDVLLYSLQRYCPKARVILLVDKDERGYIDKLPPIMPVHEVIIHPTGSEQMKKALSRD